jgi:hypothetical protein
MAVFLPNYMGPVFSKERPLQLYERAKFQGILAQPINLGYAYETITLARFSLDCLGGADLK